MPTFTFVAYAATIEQLLLPSFREPKENSNGTVNALAKRLQFRETGSERSASRRSLVRLDPGVASVSGEAVAVVAGHWLAYVQVGHWRVVQRC